MSSQPVKSSVLVGSVFYVGMGAVPVTLLSEFLILGLRRREPWARIWVGVFSGLVSAGGILAMVEEARHAFSGWIFSWGALVGFALCSSLNAIFAGGFRRPGRTRAAQTE